METKKMSLANIQGKLSRAEMKNIMAGDGVVCAYKNASGATTYGNCTGQVYQCQAVAGAWCASEPRCAGVTCSNYQTLENY
jgi:hypothetical protein